MTDRETGEKMVRTEQKVIGEERSRQFIFEEGHTDIAEVCLHMFVGDRRCSPETNPQSFDWRIFQQNNIIGVEVDLPKDATRDASTIKVWLAVNGKPIGIGQATPLGADTHTNNYMKIGEKTLNDIVSLLGKDN